MDVYVRYGGKWGEGEISWIQLQPTKIWLNIFLLCWSRFIWNMYHISMDRPSDNLKFCDVFKDTYLDGIFHSRIENGVCSLRVTHGTFRTGVEVSGWKLKSLLKGLHKILHDTPVRREDYTSIIGSVKFPHYFCGTRRVDNKRATYFFMGKYHCFIQVLGESPQDEKAVF